MIGHWDSVAVFKRGIYGREVIFLNCSWIEIGMTCLSLSRLTFRECKHTRHVLNCAVRVNKLMVTYDVGARSCNPIINIIEALLLPSKI